MDTEEENKKCIPHGTVQYNKPPSDKRGSTALDSSKGFPTCGRYCTCVLLTTVEAHTAQAEKHHAAVSERTGNRSRGF